MKRSNRLVILVGVLLAVLAFVAIVILLNDQRRATRRGPPEAVTETVLVATQDIAIGDPVTPDMVEEQRDRPRGRQRHAACGASRQVSGQPALFAIPAGSQVTGEAIGLGEWRRTSTSPPARARREGDHVPGGSRHRPRLPGQAGRLDRHRPVAGRSAVLQETADSAANTDPEAPPRFEAGRRPRGPANGQGDPPGQAGALRQRTRARSQPEPTRTRTATA